MASIEQTMSIIDQLVKIDSVKLANDMQTRKDAIALSRKLTASLETPVNRATNLIFAPYPTIAARMAIDLNLFDLLASLEGSVSTEELARLSGGEPLLIERLLRMLSSMDFVCEDSEDTWSATETTKAMAIPAIAAGHRVIHDLSMSAGVKGPRFVRENGFVSPTEPRDGLVQYAFQTKLSSFDYLSSQPTLLKDFNTFMGNTMGDRSYWYDWYPVEERLIADYDPATALLVDIGGGKGHDIQAFHSKFPGCGKLILQDLPAALDGIVEGSLDPAIEPKVYDFFTEQTIKDARVYFFHHILHDWSDKYCLQILAQLRKAMRPGYSKLLIHDLVLPNTKATTWQCSYDLNMMSFNGAIERSQKQWTNLLTEAGFEIVAFWGDDMEADGLVEAVIKS